MIHSGSLAPGHRLPTIRQLAADLGLAPGTVARTYRELEAEGLVETRGRHGTFAVDPPTRTVPHRERILDEAARSFAVTAAQMGRARGNIACRKPCHVGPGRSRRRPVVTRPALTAKNG